MARVAWQYRSELAPLPVAGSVFLAGWFAHQDAMHRYPVFIIGASVVAWLIVAFGEWLGLPQVADRAFVAVSFFAAGGWIAFAALFGPLAMPLPLVLLAAALVLAVPWWADQRRRTRARVLRTVGDWSAIAQAVGLPGSAVQAVRFEVWGWRAWLLLAPGQTIEDVAARIPVLESALHAIRGSVRVVPTHDDRADRCEIHVLGNGPQPPGRAG
jgi:S-DNA-T family DNA segregation ATPase FtsK/SpoIIIE